MDNLTKEAIAELKKKYGDIFKITVDGKSCILRKPNRKELSYASVAGKNDPIKFNESILNACFVAGDQEILTDDYLFLAASAKLEGVIEIKTAELEKL
ncbi:MAG: hypothetical protein IJT12_03975 [Paludibacteraceae bacterium]|nr:hypothetical protein [Paludibacteraceae bacterium]